MSSRRSWNDWPAPSRRPGSGGHMSDIDEVELRRWLMGDDAVKERFVARNRSPLSRAHAELQTATSHALWDRRVLDLRTMALVNLGILSALNRPHQLESR